MDLTNITDLISITDLKTVDGGYVNVDSPYNVRVMTWNVYDSFTGSLPITQQQASVQAIIDRISPDVLFIQEVRVGYESRWSTIAAALGYTLVIFSNTGYLSSSYKTGLMYKSEYGYTSSVEISNANESRIRPRITVMDFGWDKPVAIIAVHSNIFLTDDTLDDFMRAVPRRRIEDEFAIWDAANPNHYRLTLGDFNDSSDETQSGNFTSAPSGSYPSWWTLQAITYPVYYAKYPHDSNGRLDITTLDPVIDGTTSKITFLNEVNPLLPDGRRDYIGYGENIKNDGVAVYDSRHDSGGYSVKYPGTVVDSDEILSASDHLPVVGNFYPKSLIEDGWETKAKITFDKDEIDADLTAFTIIFDETFSNVLTAENGMLDADGTNPMNSDGGDIRFSLDEEGYYQLAADIRTASTDNDPANGNLEVAVKIPTLSSSSDTVIYMWWGNSAASLLSVDSAFGQYNAYDDDYVDVYALSEDPSGTAPQILSRCRNPHHGTSVGSMTTSDLVDGTVGKALSIDGGDDYIDMNYDGFNESSFTTSCMVMARTHSSSWGEGVISKWNSSSTEFMLCIASARQLYTGINAGATSVRETALFDLNVNQYVANTYDSATSTLSLYRQLTKIGSSVGARSSLTTAPFVFGAYNPLIGNQELDGTIDEVRISKVSRSESWLNTEQKNYTNKSGFITFENIVE